MLERAKRHKIPTGQCPAGREYALPPIANWQLASVPRYLVAEDVERAIAACAGERRLRDRAIVLLLARLGLRAGEVANLENGLRPTRSRSAADAVPEHGRGGGMTEYMSTLMGALDPRPGQGAFHDAFHGDARQRTKRCRLANK